MEAFIVISLVTVVLGALLYIPGRWLAKRLLRKSPPGSMARLRVTSAGLAVATLIVGLAMFGVAQPHFAPESDFGRLLSSGLGAMAYVGAVSVFGTVVSMVLETLGFTLWHRNEPDES